MKLKKPYLIRLKILEIGSLIGSIVFFIGMYRNIIEFTQVLDGLIYAIVFFIVFIFFLYLSVYDLITFSLPTSTIKKGYFLIIMLNLIIGAGRFIVFRLTGDYYFAELNLGNLDNLLAGLFCGLMIWGIIKITNNKGMGEGDIDAMAFIGLTLGWPLTFSTVLFTFISGGIVALVYIIFVRKYRQQVIPFVPIIFIGFILSITFGQLFLSEILLIDSWEKMFQL